MLIYTRVTRVTNSPGLPETVPEWEKMSRVPARFNPGQYETSWNEKIMPFCSFKKHKVIKYICNINTFICSAVQSRYISRSEFRICSLHVRYMHWLRLVKNIGEKPNFWGMHL